MIDQIINNCVAAVSSAIPGKIYGRAMIFQERWGENGIMSVPKVHVGDNEYKVPLPDDTDKYVGFFQAVGAERYGDLTFGELSGVNRQLAFTWWGKMDFGMTLEEIKWQVIRALQQVPEVNAINSYADEKYSDVFPDFIGYINRAQLEQRTNWLMMPNSGFRLVFTVVYAQTNC